MTVDCLTPPPAQAPVEPSLAPADVRTRVRVPLSFADGYATTADVFTFRDLADGQEHLLLGLGEWETAVARVAAGGEAPLVRPPRGRPRSPTRPARGAGAPARRRGRGT